ncbi:hypothetical protein BRADI_5g03136v3 [Brachypodium distachyon]|uniref:Uncharacterized protein n=1 Tax=Brachypodium distachyon TaxID=15368 RepID=A0A2K2CF73_BRADI|nr:hypothetical protein BRADI_5g03136v3 [Brachypodium distachyon]
MHGAPIPHLSLTRPSWLALSPSPYPPAPSPLYTACVAGVNASPPHCRPHGPLFGPRPYLHRPPHPELRLLANPRSGRRLPASGASSTSLRPSRERDRQQQRHGICNNRRRKNTMLIARR